MTGRTRRRFLAGLAAASGVAVAGCVDDLPWNGEPTTSFTASQAAEVETDDRPPIEWPTPVDPAKGALADAVERIDELLAQIPDPLTPEDVPNGVVRETVVDHRVSAVDVRDEAAESTTYETFRETRRAREDARNARTTFDAIETDAESLVADLSDERGDYREAVAERLDSIEYVGDGSDDGRRRAALYYRQLETDLDRADRTLERWNARETDTVVDLGEAAGELEFAAATTTVWDHFTDRYETDFGDPVALESAFVDALERSIEHVETVDFPEQDGEEWFEAVGVDDLDDQYLEFALWRAGRPVLDATRRMDEASNDGRLGTGLYHALEFERTHRAFETFRDRVADGSFASPETVAEIQAEREAAVDAAATARDAISGPSLGALVLAEAMQRLKWTDWAVERAADRDPDVTVSLSKNHRDYARVRAELEVLPEAVEAFRERSLAN